MAGGLGGRPHHGATELSSEKRKRRVPPSFPQLPKLNSRVAWTPATWWLGQRLGIGAQLGVRAATASGEDANQCVALETTRVRQRVANEIWSNYHDYICARIKFADPTPDKQRTNEDEAVSDAAKQAEQAQRYAIQAYLHTTRQPLELGV